MDPKRDQLSFPENTLFYRLDGVLFAVMPDEQWVGVDDNGILIKLSRPYAEELARMVDLWELIDEAEFRMGLAPSLKASAARKKGKGITRNPSKLRS